MSSEDKLTRKPAKKPSRTFQTAIIASRLRKRQASEASSSNNQGYSGSETPADLSSSPSEDGRQTPSHSIIRDERSFREEGTTLYSQSQIRLVRQGRPHQVLSIDSTGLDTLTMRPVLEEGLVQSPEPMRYGSLPPTTPLADQTRDTPPSSRPATPGPTASRVHWNNLRNAILSGVTLTASASSSVTASTLAQSATTPPPRSQTPKPSRLVRLGFRQVVDQTREVGFDETRKFEVEVYQACVSARFGEIRQKAERDGSQSGYLPFMSTSLPLSVASAANHQGRSGSTQSNEPNGRPAPSLKLLHQTLVRYTSLSAPSGPITWLPFETEILSVLLIPFAGEFSQHGNDERWLAVGTFELASKTWRASSPQHEIDRVLWCCKAGLISASPVRSRVLSTLSNLLSSSTPLQNGNPLALQNLLHGLQLLLHSLSKDPQNSGQDVLIVRELITRVATGAYGQLDRQEVQAEYEAPWGSQDDEGTVRDQIVGEGVVRCMQTGSEDLRRWVLHESVEAYWTSRSDSFSPLCQKIMARRLNSFLRASIFLLNPDTAPMDRRLLEFDSTAITRLMIHRALPELSQLPLPKHINDGRALVVELAMELLSTDSQAQKPQVVELICRWCEDSDAWKQSLESGLSFFIEHADWPRLTRILRAVIHELPEHVRETLVLILFPALHMRLVINPPPPLLLELTLLLRSLAQLHPQQFYKPLFSLAGASKDLTLVGQLGIVTAVARHLPEFWIHDPEMISVALMSDIGGAIGKGKAREGAAVLWGKTRIGQSLIMVELIHCVRQLTKGKKDRSSPPDGSQTQAYRFFIELENRLAILLDAKEKSSLVPFSQRILFSILFTEIRLFTRSLKPAPWLQKIVSWLVQSYIGARLHQDNSSLFLSDPPQYVGHNAFDEVLSTVSKIQSIHIACWQAASDTRQRSTVILSPAFDSRMPAAGSSSYPEADTEAIKEREELIGSMSAGVTSATSRLLVVVCALLSRKDYHIVGPVLWSRFLDEDDPCVVASTCFLLTHCLEKSPKEITGRIEEDGKSPDRTTRRVMIRRLMTLFSWRSQLLSQPYVYDRAHRRPFRMARQPITFVAIDAGSGYYVHEQTEEDRKTLPGGSLPFELRKRLAEVGWEQDDQPTDTRLERVKAPISLFPASQLEHFSTSPEHVNMDTSRSTEGVKQLLRRKSSTSAHYPGAKRRPVFVPALVSMFSSIALLAVDSDYEVASAAREAILLMLRDDPVMLCRPVMDTLSGDISQISSAVSVLGAFLHIHHRLPPSASHHIFSHLGGFLKHISRDSDNPKTLRAFSYTVPLLAKLITQVSNLSIRDLRRAKFEIYVFPSGSFWFPSTAPPSSMFPQSLAPVINPFEELPTQLMSVLMVRTAQNMLFLNMLRHKPQEVHSIRKGLTGLALPGQDIGKDLNINNFLPRKSSNNSAQGVGFRRVSLALSRSHLLLLEQIFRSMSRNFNARGELARLFDGLNRILLAHGDDIGIVAHALIACMVAVTRFKRLISSSRGFSLFMPSLLKVYAEAEGHAGIRQAIEYASSRFYAIHREAYLFQTLDLASDMLAQLDLNQDWIAKNIYELFSALKSPFNRNIPDAAGICGSNMMEEREALIATTISDDTPRTTTQDSPRGEQLKKILAVGQYESVFLNLDDLVRLLLTVIAHDPTVIRAQNFLVLLRHMAPEFYNASNSARTVLRDGINALGSALFAKAPRQRVHDSVPVRPPQKPSIDVFSHGSDEGTSILSDPSTPCDQTILQREYLSLVVTYTRMGGDLSHSTLRRALDIVKGLLKEPARPDPESEGTFLHELTRSNLSRLSVTSKQTTALLSDVAPVVKACALSIDCSGFLDTVAGLTRRPELENDDVFVRLVVDQIAGPILDVCEEAASENMLISLPMRPAVVSLVGQVASIGNTDIIGYIEKQRPSPGFLAGIVLPLCLTMKTSAEIATEQQWRYQDRLTKHSLVFVRLLVYAMESCSANVGNETGRSSPLPVISRRDSQKSKNSSLSASRRPLAALTLVVQIIKVIVVRAADDLTRGFVGIWARLARFLQHLLDDGDARFALPSNSSPAASLQSPTLRPGPYDVHLRTHSSSSDYHVSPEGAAPRVVDYLTWSLLEYFCRVPSPLTLQMRLWMQEKIHDLDTELKSREQTIPVVGSGTRRLSFSVFARPRGSSTSPDALRTSHGLPSSPSELNLSKSNSRDFGAYSRLPSPSSMQPSHSGPRIVHLGPTKDTHLFHPMERSSSQDSDLKNLARTSHIELPSLVKSTYTRVRIVQTCMGYDRLLPVDGLGDDPNSIDLKGWTRTSALAELVEETKDLMNEFSENFHENIGRDFVELSSGSGFGLTKDSPVKGLQV